MAGIGFALRKLSRRDDLLGILQGFAHSSLASAGPWLVTILALGGVALLCSRHMHSTELATFRIVIIYNFAFSLVLSGPLVMLVTRCLADQVYEKDVSAAPGMLLGSMLLTFLSQFPIAAWYYFYVVELEPAGRLVAFVNLFLVSGIWLVGVFLTALKEFRSISRAFALGMTMGVLGALWMGPAYGSTGLLFGFNLGLALVMFMLLARVLAEYPYVVHHPFLFLKHLGKYSELFAGGLVYNLAIWVDKWVMWFSPEAKTLPSGMFSYPDYDSAMFAAYLSIVPSLAIFVYSVETSFFEKYIRFYQAIQDQKNFQKIREAHIDIVRDLGQSARTFLVIQISVSAATILLAPRLFETLEISFAQLGIFRLGVLGAIFHVSFLFLSIILSYFDVRKVNLILQLIFLSSNLLFTIVFMKLGFAYYGYGYFLASLVTLVPAALVTAYYLRDLPYRTFVSGTAASRS